MIGKSGQRALALGDIAHHRSGRIKEYGKHDDQVHGKQGRIQMRPVEQEAFDDDNQ